MTPDRSRDRALVRRAFALVQQDPPPGYEQRVQQSVVERARERSPRWNGRGPRMLAIGLAIGVVAAVLVGGFAGRSALLRQSPRPRPAPAVTAPSPSPTATTTLSPGTFAYEAWTPVGQSGFTPSSDRVTSVDWSGQERATLDLHTPQGQKGHSWKASPDGSLLLASGTDGESIYDPTGALVGKTVNFGIWASDDDVHGCYTDPGVAGGSLQVSTVHPAEHQVTTVSVPITGLLPGNRDVVVQCSVARDEAAVFEVPASPGMGSVALDIVQLSTGRVLRRHSYSLLLGSNTLVSPDGRYVAENDPSGSCPIRELATDQVVGHVTGRVVGFSSDGSRAVVVRGAALQQPGSSVAVVDWRTGRVVWTHASASGAQVVGRPGSEDLALEVSSAGTPGDVYLVSGDGGHRLIAHNAAPLAPVTTLGEG